jgi:hypothetical protein
MVGAVTLWRFASGSAVEARSARRMSLWSMSVVEGVVSKEGNGEQGPRRWFNGRSDSNFCYTAAAAIRL